MDSAAERTPSSPNAAVSAYLEQAVRRWRSGEEALGERLYVLDDGPGEIRGAQRLAVGLDRQGLTVLVIASSDPSERQPEALADELARIAGLSERDFARAGGVSREELRRLHGQHFGLGERAPINGEQRLLVLLAVEPGETWWAGAVAELGPRLEEVYLVRDRVADPLRADRHLARPRGRMAALLGSRWAAAAAGALAAAVVAVALTAVLDRGTSGQLPVIEGFVSSITTGVAGDSTHTQWTGQHHIVQTSDRRLQVLYASAGRLHVVGDRGDGGRSWEDSIAVHEIRTTGFAAAVDARDRLLLAYTDDRALRFTSLSREKTGWEPGPALVLDRRSSSRVVDVAWDPTAKVAHVVWAAADEHGEHPRWAAVVPGRRPRLLQSSALAPPGEARSVLSTVVVTPAAEVVVAYRRGDRGGFFSRSARRSRPRGAFAWGREEAVATDDNFGAVSLVVDGQGTLHLALRADGNPSLRYFRKRSGTSWQTGEVAVSAPTSEEIDFPTLSVDERSRLVYLFFQNAAVKPSPQIRVLVRDPEKGWQGSYQVINPAAVPNGANFPIASGTVTGSASVVWTKKGPIPELQLARFFAP